MKTKKALSLFFALLALVLAVLTLLVCRTALDMPPVLVTAPEAASETVDQMMDAVCRGDYDAAAARMYGNPDLGADRDPADEVGMLLWEAFRESLRYELKGTCYATDSGISQDIAITCLDFSSVTASLQERARQLLVQRVEEAEDADAIYDENGDYREEFVMEVLHDVTLDALKTDARDQELQLTVQLIYRQGQWWVLPDQALLAAISGGVAG